MEISEIGLSPQPYAKANVDIIYEGVVVVDFKNLGLQLVEKSPDDPYKMINRVQSLNRQPEVTATSIASVMAEHRVLRSTTSAQPWPTTPAQPYMMISIFRILRWGQFRLALSRF